MQGAFGTSGTLTWITIGKTVYFKPNSTAWQTLAGTDAAKIIQIVDGRYVKDPLSDVHLGTGFSCVIYTPGKAVVTKGQVTMLNGIRVLPLKDPGGGVIYVTDTGKPEFDRARLTVVGSRRWEPGAPAVRSVLLPARGEQAEGFTGGSATWIRPVSRRRVPLMAALPACARRRQSGRARRPP